ncbi:protein hmgX [Aspergillus undulatus]|uniref:protein hmgX n=1 Tax=Aspergillus undulatus TaxID=1810928 RepID=UPI003CCD4FBA
MSATTTPTKPALTINDSAVLQALFDAESSPSSGVTIDTDLPQLPAHLNISAKEHGFLQAREKEIIQPLASASTPTSSPTPETLQCAIDALDDLIKNNPTYPSAYANRAQALRMLVEHDPHSEEPGKTATYTSTLLSDLEKAITLTTPPSPADAMSPYQAHLLADTHTHRAYLLLKFSRELKSNHNQGKGNGDYIPRNMIDLGPDALEEMASRDFFMGGRYGNKVAQQMAVQTNPYAKMCGAIVKEAMRKEVEGLIV